MPYIIITKRPDKSPSRVGFADDMRVTGTPQAVPTLDEARRAACEAVNAAFPMNWVRSGPPHPELLDACNALPESGGTVGPLPDDSVIDVQHASWDDLVGPGGWNASTTEAEVIAAFNGRGE